MLLGVVAVLLGVVVFFTAPAILTADYCTITLIGSIFLTVVGLVNFIVALYDLHIPKFFRRLNRDKRGIGWVWVVAAITLIFMPFIYWGIGSALDVVFIWIDASYVFTGTMSSAYVLIRAIIPLLSVFMLIGVVLWSVINAKASRYGD